MGDTRVSRVKIGLLGLVRSVKLFTNLHVGYQARGRRRHEAHKATTYQSVVREDWRGRCACACECGRVIRGGRTSWGACVCTRKGA